MEKWRRKRRMEKWEEEKNGEKGRRERRMTHLWKRVATTKT